MIYKNISKSGVSTIDRCPAKADLHKNHGIESIGNIYANKGKLGHKIMQMLCEKQITPSQMRLHCPDEEVLNWSELALKNHPYPFDKFPERFCEAHVMINKEGVCVDDEAESDAHGYLDDTIFTDDDLVVLDYKFGSAVYDDIVERHFYAGLFAKSAQPEFDRIRFVRYYCRKGKAPEWVYEWKKRRDGSSSLYITNPKGEKKQVRGQHPTNPLIPWLGRLLKRIEDTAPVAKPGDHCRNWFGAPCQFFGNLCPASDHLPDILPTDRIMNNPQQDAFLTFFRAEKPEDYISLSPELASLALEAVYRLDGGVMEVEKRVKEWSRINGQVSISNDNYGWFEYDDAKIDKASVLEFLYDSGLVWSDISKVVNISKSSLDRLPNKLVTIKDSLFKSISYQAKQKFGLIPRKENVETTD